MLGEDALMTEREGGEGCPVMMREGRRVVVVAMYVRHFFRRHGMCEECVGEAIRNSSSWSRRKKVMRWRGVRDVMRRHAEE